MVFGVLSLGLPFLSGTEPAPTSPNPLNSGTDQHVDVICRLVADGSEVRGGLHLHAAVGHAFGCNPPSACACRWGLLSIKFGTR